MGIKNMFSFTSEEIRRLSDLSVDEWQKIRSQVVAKPPYDLENRARALREAHAVLTACGIKFWLTMGSLLGAVRDNDFIPWDDDVDMDMLEEDFVSVMYKLKERLIEAGFIVRLTDTKKYPKMSFFKYGQKLSLGALCKYSKRWRVRPRYKYPNHCFLKEEYIEFKGMRFLVPSPVDEFLTHCYKNWRIPIKSNFDTDEGYHSPVFFRKYFINGLKNTVKKCIGYILR